MTDVDAKTATLRPALRAGRFLLPQHALTLPSHSHSHPPQPAPAPGVAADDAARHYQPHSFDQCPPLIVHRLTQPLVLTSAWQVRRAEDEVDENSSSSPSRALTTTPFTTTSSSSSSRSIQSNANATSKSYPRCVLSEAGCSLSLLRHLSISSGSYVEITATTAAIAPSPNSQPHPPPPRSRTVIATLHAVDITKQIFEGKRQFMRCRQETRLGHDNDMNGALVPFGSTKSTSSLSSSSSSSSASSVSSASPSSTLHAHDSWLLLPPSLHFHLFELDAPLSSSSHAQPDLHVRIRRYLPSVPSVLSSTPHGNHHGANNIRSNPHLRHLPSAVHTVDAMDGSGPRSIPIAHEVRLARVPIPGCSSRRSYATSLRSLFSIDRPASAPAPTAIPSSSSSVPLARLMYAGSDTILCAPLQPSTPSSRHCWLTRPPPSAEDQTPDVSVRNERMDADEMDGMDDEAVDEDEEDETSLWGGDTSFTSNSHPRLAFFRITSVQPSWLVYSSVHESPQYFFIDPNRTVLMTEGSSRCRVPFQLESYLHAPPSLTAALTRMPRWKISPINGQELNLAASVMRHTAEQISALFLPALHAYAAAASTSPLSPIPAVAPTLQLQPSLFLCGARRSCKRSLLFAVSRSLGVHYVEANCYTLLAEGGSAGEGGVLTLLNRLFLYARQHAPCILHLRKLQAIKAWLSSQQKDKDVIISSGLQSLIASLSSPLPPPLSSESTSPSTSSLSPPVFFVASCDSLSNVSIALRNLFLDCVRLTPPSLDDRRKIVLQTIRPTDAETAENEAMDEHKADIDSDEHEKETDRGPKLLMPADSEDEKNEERLDSSIIEAAAAESAAIVARSHLTSSPSPSPSPPLSDASSFGLSASKLARLIAQKTAGLSVGDVSYFLASVAKVATERWMQDMEELKQQQQAKTLDSKEKSTALTVSDSSTALYSTTPTPSPPVPPPRLRSSDIDTALSLYSARASAQTGTMASTPNVKWSDVGGLENVKREVMEAIELPLRFPQLFANGVKKRAGILLYGPPGTGKTMIAKAVATECNLNFMSVKGPELLNMYIGESERNIRQVFTRARHAKPVVIFFDELDALAPRRGQGSDGGGVMDRVVAALLAELDSGVANDGVFVIAATNRPDLIEAGLLRPGRLDRCVYLGVSDTREQQVNILKALTRKFHLASDVDLHAVVAHCSFTWSGADFYALASDALLLAMKRKIDEMEGAVEEAREDQRRRIADKRKEASLSHHEHALERADNDDVAMDEYEYDEPEITPASYMASLRPSDLIVTVTQSDLLQAQRSVVPSLDADQLEHYKKLQQQFSVTHQGGSGHTEEQLPEQEEDRQGKLLTTQPTPQQQRALVVPKPETETGVSVNGSDHVSAPSIHSPTSHSTSSPSSLIAATAASTRPMPASPNAHLSALDLSMAHSDVPLSSTDLSLRPSESSLSSSTSSTHSHAAHTMPLLEWERAAIRNGMQQQQKEKQVERPSRGQQPTSYSSYSAYSSYSSDGTASSSVSYVGAAPSRPLKPWERNTTTNAMAPPTSSAPYSSSATNASVSSSLNPIPVRPLKPWERKPVADAPTTDASSSVSLPSSSSSYSSPSSFPVDPAPVTTHTTDADADADDPSSTSTDNSTRKDENGKDSEEVDQQHNHQGEPQATQNEDDDIASTHAVRHNAGIVSSASTHASESAPDNVGGNNMESAAAAAAKDPSSSSTEPSTSVPMANGDVDVDVRTSSKDVEGDDYSDADADVGANANATPGANGVERDQSIADENGRKETAHGARSNNNSKAKKRKNKQKTNGQSNAQVDKRATNGIHINGTH